VAEATVLTVAVLAGTTLLRPLVNAINRAPIDERQSEAIYEIHVVTGRRPLARSGTFWPKCLKRRVTRFARSKCSSGRPTLPRSLRHLSVAQLTQSNSTPWLAYWSNRHLFHSRAGLPVRTNRSRRNDYEPWDDHRIGRDQGVAPWSSGNRSSDSFCPGYLKTRVWLGVLALVAVPAISVLLKSNTGNLFVRPVRRGRN
jgi:hypothetical protein